MEDIAPFKQTGKIWPESWLPRSWALGLFQKFSLLYLQRFTGNFPDTETKNEWCEVWASGLAGLSGEQIKYGLGYIGQHSEWPPTIVEFRSACESCPPADVPRLPEPARAEHTHALRQLAKIKELLAQPQRKPGKWWAHEIIEQHEAGIHVLPKALELATEAMR